MGVEAGDPRLPLGVDGSIQRLRHWIHVSQVNCDQYIFGYFCDTVCSDIEENPVPGDELRWFLWENLSLHKTAYVTHVIKGHSNDAQKSISVDQTLYRPNGTDRIRVLRGGGRVGTTGEEELENGLTTYRVV